MHTPIAAPSPWVERWEHLICPGGHVLDVACGSGRHVRRLTERGFKLTALDRDADALQHMVPRQVQSVPVAGKVLPMDELCRCARPINSSRMAKHWLAQASKSPLPLKGFKRPFREAACSSRMKAPCCRPRK